MLLHTQRAKTVLNCWRWLYKINVCLLNRAGHHLLCQPKENTGQNHHQREDIQTLTMQLRHIGDSVNHRVIQEVRRGGAARLGREEEADRWLGAQE